MSKRYYWMKLKDDFFSSKRIKKLRSIAGGDTFLIIYLKMQLSALRSDGVITFTGLEDDFAKELALDLDEDEDNVRITLNYLQKVGLLETSDDIDFFLPYVVENIGSEGPSAKRMRDHRQRQASLCDTSVTQPLHLSDGEKEIDIEKDIEKEIDIEKDIEKEIDREKEKEPSKINQLTTNRPISVDNSVDNLSILDRLSPNERQFLEDTYPDLPIVAAYIDMNKDINKINNPLQYVISVANEDGWRAK